MLIGMGWGKVWSGRLPGVADRLFVMMLGYTASFASFSEPK